MQSEKHLDTAVLLYLFLLLIFVIVNMTQGINILDLIYLIVVLCCVLKYFIIKNNRKK